MGLNRFALSSRLTHPYVIRTFGACTEDMSKPILVLEVCPRHASLSLSHTNSLPHSLPLSLSLSLACIEAASTPVLVKEVDPKPEPQNPIPETARALKRTPARPFWSRRCVVPVPFE